MRLGVLCVNSSSSYFSRLKKSHKLMSCSDNSKSHVSFVPIRNRTSLFEGENIYMYIYLFITLHIFQQIFTFSKQKKLLTSSQALPSKRGRYGDSEVMIPRVFPIL